MEILKKSWPVLLLFMTVSLLGAFQAASSPETVLPPGWTHPGPPKDVCALAIQADTLWAGGMEGLWAFSAVNGSPAEAPAPLSVIRGINALHTDAEGTLWIGTDTGLFGWKDNTLSVYAAGSGLPDKRVTVLTQDSTGCMWIGTWGGLATLKNGKPIPAFFNDKLADPMVSAILFDSQGRMWIGSAVAPRGGLTVIDGNAAQTFTYPQLPHNNVNCLLARANGEVWAGTGFNEAGGLAVFGNSDGQPVLDRVLTIQDGLVGEKIRSLWESAQGSLLIATEYDGVTLWTDHAVRHLNENSGLRENEVKQWLVDAQGTLWLGTRLGVTCIQQDAVAVMTASQ